MKKPLLHLPTTFVMLDSETLAIATDAAVLQIGAAAWRFREPAEEIENPQVEDTAFRSFDEPLNLQAQIDLGRTLNADTIGFHLRLGADCLKKSINCSEPLAETLIAFANFFNDLDDYAVLARGVAFDMPIIESLMVKVGIQVPWKYNQVWDHRTIVNLMGDPGIKRPETYVNHDGYWDARFQLRQLIGVFEKMGAAEEPATPTNATRPLNLNPQRELKMG